jgi:MFS family permease
VTFRIFNLLTGYPRQFKLMFWGMLISTTGASMIWPFLMIYVKGRVNLPLSNVAVLTSINALSGLFSALLAGPIADRLGRKWVLVFSLVGNGLVYFFMSQASTLPAFAVLMVFSGIFNPVYRVSSDAMVADLIPPEQRPDAYALLRLSNNVGISIGPSLGGLLTVLSYSFSFFFAATGMICYGLLLAFLAVETLPVKTSAQNITQTFAGYLKVLSDRPFLSFVTVFTLIQIAAVFMWVLLPVYTHDQYRIPESQYGFIPTTNALMVVFFQVAITKITRKYPPLPMMAIGSLLYAIGVGSVALGGSFIAFWGSMVIMTLGELILMPTASTYVAYLAPADMRGRYMSISGLTWNAAYGIAPITGGYLNDHVAPRAIWIGGLVTGLAAFLGYSVMAKRHHQADLAKSLEGTHP